MILLRGDRSDRDRRVKPGPGVRGSQFRRRPACQQGRRSLVEKPGPPPGSTTEQLIGELRAGSDSLFVSAGAAVWRLNLRTGVWSELKVESVMRRVPPGVDPLVLLALEGTGAYPPLFYRIGTPEIRRGNDFRARAAGKKALYAGIPAVRRNLAGLIATVHACGMNSMVIDMKDDQGNLYFPTNNETALRSGAARKPIDVRAVLGALRREGIYSIARVVVFKDPKFVRYDITATRSGTHARIRPGAAARANTGWTPIHRWCRNTTSRSRGSSPRSVSTRYSSTISAFPSTADAPVSIPPSPARGRIQVRSYRRFPRARQTNPVRPAFVESTASTPCTASAT